jgi:hypothetical protein
MRQKNTLHAQALVEFALIIPIVLALLLGFFDLGRAVFYNSSLSNAVREATRTGIVMGYNQDSMKEKIIEYAFALPITEGNLDVQVEGSEDPSGWPTLEITAKYCFAPITPGIISIVGNCFNGDRGITLTSVSVMRVEYAE